MSPDAIFAAVLLVAALAYALHRLRTPFAKPSRTASGLFSPFRRGRRGEDSLVKLVRAIPRGKVITYHRLTALAGPGAEALGIARRMRALEGVKGVPWWRVVHQEGSWGVVPDAPAGEKQRDLLQAEGIVFSKERFHLEGSRWEEPEALPKRKQPA